MKKKISSSVISTTNYIRFSPSPVNWKSLCPPFCRSLYRMNWLEQLLDLVERKSNRFDKQLMPISSLMINRFQMVREGVIESLLLKVLLNRLVVPKHSFNKPFVNQAYGDHEISLKNVDLCTNENFANNAVLFVLHTMFVACFLSFGFYSLLFTVGCCLIDVFSLCVCFVALDFTYFNKTLKKNTPTRHRCTGT